MNKLRLAIILVSVAWITGCSLPGSNNFLGSDPVTGGVDAPASKLLDLPLPVGLQRYAGHGFVNTLPDGNREGLEILRGPVDSRASALSLFNTLKSHGWQLLGAQRKNSRAIYLYGKNGEHAIISFHPQGTLTIVEIWRARQLPPDSELPEHASELPETSIVPEEYGPLDEKTPDIQEERWGTPLEEREL